MAPQPTTMHIGKVSRADGLAAASQKQINYQFTIDVRKYIRDLETRSKIKLHDDQLRALRDNLRSTRYEQLDTAAAKVHKDLYRNPKVKEKTRLHGAHSRVIESIKKHIKFLEQELKAIEDVLKEHTLSREAVSSLAGLAPMNQDSGNSRGKMRIQKGRSVLRNSLYMPTLSATQSNVQIKKMYNRLIEAGKPAKVALTACMRKLLCILNSMVRENRTWRFE